ncbi:MAG: mechanosensitive ion channel domain-containing protein [Parasphingopyxis sp.]|uniref:mechanosensitive ion channel domain-containing protein n=1 Tax=Parasphingopyxis sp. TaxID=1920299 RepID=UPI003F9F0F85
MRLLFLSLPLCLMLCLAAAPAAGQDLLTSEAEPSAEPPEQAIELSSEGPPDREIADRIADIFGQIDALSDVSVESRAGVVTLAGTVPTAEDIARAEAIASRVTGVVTVENELERNLDVETNVAPTLVAFQDNLRGLANALPLVAVAFGIAILIGLLGYWIAARERLWQWIAPNVFMAELIATSIRFLAIVIAMLVLMQILGATALLGAVLGGAGVIGLAIGFAVRDTVDNYVSSLMLSLRQPFRANDHIVVDTHEGRVVRLTSRATILMTLDGNQLRVPNSVVFKSVILNYTRNPERRFTFELGIDAEDDAADGIAVGLAALNALPFVLATPEATGVIHDVGDSNIVLTFHGWLDQTQTDFHKGRSKAIQAAKAALEEQGFALPEPIYRLRFDDMAPLPIKRALSGASGRPPQPAKPPPPDAADDQDTAPDTHIERLVAEERAETGGKDLLDDSRPIE